MILRIISLSSTFALLAFIPSAPGRGRNIGEGAEKARRSLTEPPLG